MFVHRSIYVALREIYRYKLDCVFADCQPYGTLQHSRTKFANCKMQIYALVTSDRRERSSTTG